MIDIRGIRQRWESDGSKRDERGRRVFAASEARAAGHGGVTAVSQITGLARSTIGRGLEDLDPARVDLSGGTIAIRSLKKRRDASGSAKIVFRSVPVPAEFLDTLDIANGLREAQKSRKKAAAPIWPVSRVRIWQIVKHVMIEAGIPDGPHRSPKGLRHGYGVHATVQGVPMHMLQRWLGHAQLSTTAVYAQAVGKEEQDIAARMWG